MIYIGSKKLLEGPEFTTFDIQTTDGITILGEVRDFRQTIQRNSKRKMGIELLISNPVYGVGVQSANHFTTSSDVQRSEFW